MNNTQLDMVLGYLNEGTEIDEYDYMAESLNEMVEYSINESNIITSLLEENDTTKKEWKSSNAVEKIGELIKRFVNWVKSLITKLKIKIRQISTKIVSSQIKKMVQKQKELIKDIDPKITMTLNSSEYILIATMGQYLNYSKSDMELNLIFAGFATDVTDIRFSDGDIIKNRLIAIGIKLFSKLPYPIVALGSGIITKLEKKKGYIVSKEEKTITIEEYNGFLDMVPAMCKNISNILDQCLKGYEEEIKYAKDMNKKGYDKYANEYLRGATNLANATTSLSTSGIKILLLTLKLCKKNINNAKSSK